jgi:Lon-like ATP-dependent protease
MIAVNKLKRVGTNAGPGSEKRKGFVILLNGPPGTGKTTIAKAIATALKRESRFISFAGVTDPAFVKGHKRTYLDAQPGVFVKELVKSKVMNPVFILDEVDKLSKHHQGVDPYYALMEILNPEENHNFTDHYLDIKVDFSNVIFILTANQILNMLEPLRNRLEIIEVPAYIEQEKLLIGKEYLLPAVLAEHGLDPHNIVFDDEALTRIIKGWCYYESGVREFRRCLERISRKHALEILDDYSIKFPKTQPSEEPIEITSESKDTTEEQIKPEVIKTPEEALIEGQNIEFINIKPSKNDVRTPEGKDPAEKKEKLHVTTQSEFLNQEDAKQLVEFRQQKRIVFEGEKDDNDEQLKKYLGLPVFDDQYERRNKKLHKGTVNVLTVSGFVGHVLSVECVYDITNPEKKGQFSCSGNLQKVLQESLTIARLVALRFLPPEKIKEMSEKSVHIHFLQGGTPKDGPSAGISICSALLSLVLDKPIDAMTSMTGELSLNGEVYKIGGVQAKVTASKALGIKRILLPWGNKTDFIELPQLLKDDLEVYFVKEYQQVYDVLFGESPKDLERIDKFVNGKYVGAAQISSESSTVNA